MSIKIALLKSGEQIITDVKELMSDDKPVGYLFRDPEKITLNKPFLVQEDVVDNSVEVSLTGWILLTTDREMVVPSEWVVTLVEPIDSVVKMYEEKIDGKDSEMSSTEDG